MWMADFGPPILKIADGDPLAPRWFPSLLALEITTADIRQLIRDISIAHPLWGAPLWSTANYSIMPMALR